MSVAYQYQDSVAGGSSYNHDSKKHPSSSILARTMSGFGIGIVTILSSSGVGIDNYEPSSTNYHTHFQEFTPQTTHNLIFDNSEVKRLYPLQFESEVTISERLSMVRSYLSLNISELSDALMVKRPTIYSWMDGSSFPSDRNQARIATLYEIAKAWKSYGKGPIGNYKKVSLINGKSLLDIVNNDSYDLKEVLNLFSKIIKGKPKQTSLSISELAQQHGFQSRTKEEKRASFELASTKYKA